jgi:DNA-binding SARP family transcriptional activator/tetratricopeptide (TPR) repeat protein
MYLSLLFEPRILTKSGESAMEFRILGPLEVVAEGQVIEPGGPRERIILSMLLLDLGRIVPIERLIDAVWDESPPKTARTQIQICVASLRHKFKSVSRYPTIVTRHPGYAVGKGEWRLDAEVFEELVSAAQAAIDGGDTASAAESLRSALSLWRGEPLAGVASRLVQTSAVRLRERKLLATEDWAELELELGRHESLIGQHFELVAEHPYQERLHEQLMLALHRSGRSAEALEVCRSLRRVLAGDLGIQPGKRLAKLERAILSNDTGPVAAQASRARITRVTHSLEPRQLPADISDFTGPAELIARVEQALTPAETAPDQRPRGMRIAAIAGAAGLGKTALAIHTAHRLAHRFPGGQLYADLRGDQAGPADPAAVLERFLAALGIAGTAIPADPDERLDLYRSRLSDQQVLIVLDNAAGESQLMRLLPGSSTCAVLITARRRITALPGVAVLELEPLDTEDGVTLLGRIAGEQRIRLESGAARALVGHVDGLPLAIRIAGARLAARPHWTVAGLAERLADERRRLDLLEHEHLSVRDSLSSMFDLLSPNALRLALSLGLAQPDGFAGWIAAALLDLPEAEAHEYLEMLIDAQLVQVVCDTVHGRRYRMRGLVRAYARQRGSVAFTPAERGLMTARVLSGWLVLAGLAHTAEYGAEPAMTQPVPRTWSPSPAVLDQVLADPAGWAALEHRALVTAVHQAATAGLADVCWAVAMIGAVICASPGDVEEWRELQHLALEVARQAGDTVGEAAVLYALGGSHLSDHQYHAATPLLDAALDVFRASGDPVFTGLTLSQRAHVDRMSGRFGQAHQGFAEALKLLRGSGDRTGIALVLCGTAETYLDSGQALVAQRFAEEALAVSQAARARRMEACALRLLGEVNLATQPVRAQRLFSRALSLARLRNDRVAEAHALLGWGQADSQAKEGSQASTHLLSALRVARDTGERLTEGRALLALGELQATSGEQAGARQYLRQAHEVFDGLGLPGWTARAKEGLDSLDRPARITSAGSIADRKAGCTR